MAVDHLQFLKDRFIREFEEADEEFTSKFPIRHRLKKVMEVVRERTISNFTPIRMKDCLYDLIHALAECRVICERYRECKAQKKKWRVGLQYSPAELWLLLRIVRKLRRIKKKLMYELQDDVAPAAESSASTAALGFFPSIRTYRPQDFPNGTRIHGFDDQVERLEAFLLGKGGSGSGSIMGISIVGMGGSGKTALAWMVFLCEQVQQRFSPMIWVELPDDLDPNLPDCRVAIVRSILKHLHHDDNGGVNDDGFEISITPDGVYDDLDNMLREMRRRLRGQKYLIVLDNAWRESEWYSNLVSGELGPVSGGLGLCHGLPGESGGAVIVTSRLDQVAKAMVTAGGGGGHDSSSCLHHQVQPLSDDAGAIWSIFMDTFTRKEFMPVRSHNLNPKQRMWKEAVRRYRTHNLNLKGSEERMWDEAIVERMRDEVVDRCAGLPLAAMTLAALTSYLLWEGRLRSDPTATKRCRLSLGEDVRDVESICTALAQFDTSAGVHSVGYKPRPANEIMVEGSGDPWTIVYKIRQFFAAELVSIDMKL